MREDTRTRIQQIALELFIEKGYEATSLREISEQLGVTKAALYYHFKTKDDIVLSLIEERVAELDRLLEWAKSRPKDAHTRRELVERYADQLYTGRHSTVMHFLERNQTSLRGHPTTRGIKERMIALVEQLSEPDEPHAVRLRRAMALFTLHAGLFLAENRELSAQERQAAALEVALDLVER
ncbi:TetR/AcrR family transcriptional regulator [Nonomuraea soli]|uniref:AcrR family transcriptional regulator n=1 Tax=Nonomuraea soli TaxID=1032476 RepID=A0A7W0CS15_9ACTN|nr:TetR/AcrR family transcriptional regulator [Nonomuraea soli]MBA2896217.1 AcrR family transcriptional regulator [Nonomuraea soli]